MQLSVSLMLPVVHSHKPAGARRQLMGATRGIQMVQLVPLAHFRSRAITMARQAILGYGLARPATFSIRALERLRLMETRHGRAFSSLYPLIRQVEWEGWLAS